MLGLPECSYLIIGIISQQIWIDWFLCIFQQLTWNARIYQENHRAFHTKLKWHNATRCPLDLTLNHNINSSLRRLVIEPKKHSLEKEPFKNPLQHSKNLDWSSTSQTTRLLRHPPLLKNLIILGCHYTLATLDSTTHGRPTSPGLVDQNCLPNATHLGLFVNHLLKAWVHHQIGTHVMAKTMPGWWFFFQPIWKFLRQISGSFAGSDSS